MRTVDLYWAAGFLEGEGSFHSQRTNVAVDAVQVQREPLERLQAIFGGRIHECRPQREGWKPYFKWGVTGSQAAGIAMTLFSLMSPRRKDQIEAAVTKWKNAPLENGKKTVCAQGHPFDDLNTYWTSKGYRACRKCRNRARDERKDAALLN